MVFTYKNLEELLTAEGIARWKADMSTDRIGEGTEGFRGLSDREYLNDAFLKSNKGWFTRQKILSKLYCQASEVPHPMLRFVVWKLGIKVPLSAIGKKGVSEGFRFICSRCSGGMHNDLDSVVCYNCKECSVGWEQRPKLSLSDRPDSLTSGNCE